MFNHFYRLFFYNILIIGVIWQYGVVRGRHVHFFDIDHNHHANTNLTKNPRIQPRILGGTNVISRELYPYQVSIQIEKLHLCGGAILDKRWILTAAHCVVDTNLIIVAGTNNLANLSMASYYTPQEIITHCNYDYPEFTNDIALIRTVETIIFSNGVKAIPLGIRFPLNNGKLILTGWGATENTDGNGHNSFPEFLQSLEFKAISHAHCNKEWSKSGGIDIGNVCAYNDIHKGACNGDSGSPLAFNGELVAIASYVMACAKGMADVFASIPFHLDFIRTTMQTCEDESSTKKDRKRASKKKRSLNNHSILVKTNHSNSDTTFSARTKYPKWRHEKKRTKYHTISIQKRKDLEIRTHHAWKPKPKMHIGRHGSKFTTWGQRIHVQ